MDSTPHAEYPKNTENPEYFWVFRVFRSWVGVLSKAGLLIREQHFFSLFYLENV